MASDWLGLILAEENLGGLDGLLGEEEHDRIIDDILDGRLDPHALIKAQQDVVTLVSGRPWWVTLRLLYMAQGSWDAIGGYMASHGVNATQMPLQAWMDALLATILKHMDPKNHSSMMTKLKMPPKGVDAPKIDEAREADLFRAYMKG